MTLRVNKLKNLGICGRPYYFCVDNYMENLVLLNRPNDTVSKRRVSRKRKCRYELDLTQNFGVYFSQFYLISWYILDTVVWL